MTVEDIQNVLQALNPVAEVCVRDKAGTWYAITQFSIDLEHRKIGFEMGERA